MKLKDYREKQNLTLEQAADQLGVTAPTLCRYEAGRFPDPEIARRIVKWSGGKVTADDLLAAGGE